MLEFGTGKKLIVIVGRVHPGESNASWVVHGLLKYLAQTNAEVTELLEKY